jgi:pyridoxal phosphate enzyme (YggS family)
VNPSVARERIRERWRGVVERVEKACRRAQRDPREVTIIAVTKTVSSETAALLPDLGIVELGESRPQELWRKAERLPPTVRWHLIGHLQRNKVERTVRLRPVVHSVDSLQLLEALAVVAAQLPGDPLRVFLEVNVSGERQKHGFRLEELAGARDLVVRLNSGRLVVVGLMTMAPLSDDPERARPIFAALHALRDDWKDLPPPHRVEHLSMGMSQDFEVAVEEGATYLRLGSVLFEGLDEGTGE